MKIAIDGPAGAGKSSIAKLAARELGFIYIDTGAMYRASALYAIENGIEICEKSFTEEVLDKINIDIKYDEEGQKIFLCGKDVSKRIREADVSIGASDIAVIPAVRLKLVELQRELAKGNDVIMDGRDIGTYVLPDAELKIFLTATSDERAKRRLKELMEKGQTADFEQVKRDIEYRDKNDSEREFAPLRRADDAILVDSTEMSIDDVKNCILKLAKEKM
ncbi:MAG: (d)CMP kinase [Clostridia bacterium]|nr:(d)CMP kinase [Clostridia bacterium]MBR0277934.1 (d)CMP kinase [Clostridia bacterium]